MRTQQTRWTPLALAGLLMTLAGCPTEEEPPPTTGDTDGEDSDGAACDPVGADAEMGMLLNAPVAEDVEVIQKQAQHPGAAGPEDLP